MRAQPKGRSFQLLFPEFEPAHQHQNAGENQLPTALDDPSAVCVVGTLGRNFWVKQWAHIYRVDTHFLDLVIQFYRKRYTSQPTRVK